MRSPLALGPRPPIRLGLVVLSLLVASLGHAQDAAPVELLPREDGEPGARLEIRVPGLRWVEDAGLWRASLPGFGPLTIEGRPELPVRLERVALPPGARLVLDDVQVAWEEGSLPRPLSAFALSGRRAAEGGAGYWPQSVVSIRSQQGWLRQARFATLEVRPMQVDLAAGRFRLARAIEVSYRIEGGEVATRSMPRATGESALFENLAPSLLHGAVVHDTGALSSLNKNAPTDADIVETYPAWQMLVEREGIFRVTHAWMQANAPGLLAFLQGEDPRRLRLSSQGLELPLRVEGEGDGSFDPGDALVFYGQPLVGDPFEPSEWQGGDFSDVNVYRLDTADTPLRLDADPLFAPPTLGVVPPSFRDTARREDDARFQQQTPEAGVDHWYADPFILFGGTESLDQIVETPDHVGGSVDVRARLLGFDRLHQTQVRLDGVLVDTQDWDGIIEFTHDVPVDRSASPLAASSTVNVSITNARQNDQVALNWVEIDYDRAYRARGGLLLFDVANDADYELRLDNFAGLPEVWEVGETLTSGAGLPLAQPRVVTGVALSGGLPAFDVLAGPSPRRFFAAEPGSFFTLASSESVREDVPTSVCAGGSLRGAECEGEWVVIGPAEFLAGPELAALAARRQSQGYATATINLQDIYDEFSYGLEDPEAIRRFFDASLPGGASAWSRAPEAAILLGDATYDYKNDYAHAVPRNIVSTASFDFPSNENFRIYVSDLWFTQVRGDDELPDLFIGRIPAHDFTEAEVVFRKILDYENVSPAEPWTGKVLMVSEAQEDPGDVLGSEFDAIHDQLFDTWFVGEAQTAEKVYESDPWLSSCTTAADDQNAAYDAAVNAGAAITSFAGHGSFRSWGRTCTFFQTAPPAQQFDDDLNDIAQGTPLQFHVHANCITGAFGATSSPSSSNDSWYVFMEDFLLTEGKGAIGAIAPSHLAYSYLLEPILSPFYEGVFGREKERSVALLDLKVRESLERQNFIVPLRSMILYGDPLLTLAVPAPEAPTIQSVDPDGDEALLVTWSAVPGADAYRVFRAENPNGPYTMAAEVTSAETSYRDTGLVNCRTYYYYVVSVDARGFESRWSNFNDTCFTTNDPADCKSGEPVDPDPPPAPLWSDGTGNNPPPVEDLQQGGRLKLSWNKVDPALDVVSYRIQWGTTPGGPYPNEKVVQAFKDSDIVGGLEDGVEHYFVIRSEHCSAIGPAGEERSGIPRLVRGINPPATVSDLMVFKAADATNGVTDGVDDVRLQWALPTESVWGLETTLSAVEVYGSSERADFPTNPSTRLAQLPANATEWTHELDGATPPNWRYLVVVVDDAGLASAAGADNPGPVSDLRVEREGSTLFFRWTAVGGGMQGAPGVSIAGYNLYGRSSLLPRGETSDANLIVFFPQGRPGDELVGSDALPADAFFSYQLLSVDYHGTEAVW